MDTETLKTIVTVLSVVAAIYFGIKNVNRNNAHDYSNDKSHVARLDAGLEEISRDVKDIKSDMVRMRDSINDSNVRQRSTEAQVEHLVKRVDKLEEDVRQLRDNCSYHKTEREGAR